MAFPCLALGSIVTALFFSSACGDAESSSDDDSLSSADAGREGPRGRRPSNPKPDADDDSRPSADDEPEPGASHDDDANDDGDDDAPGSDDVPEPDVPPSSSPDTVTRVARLSHAQYRATVRDLLGIDDPPGDAFAPDALNGFEFDTTVDYRVDARLGPAYRDAAELLAARAGTDAAVFDFIVPCDAADDGCKGEFVASFGQRAFRRPLSADEQERFEALFDRGAELVGSGDAFADGVSLVVEAMLQSPQFLYRTEQSSEVAADGTIALDGWEVASRLSYFLWNTMPDAELFQAAADGSLVTREGLRSQVNRLLADERAVQKLLSFHEQAWKFDKLSRVAPDFDVYPEAPRELGSRALEANRRFVSHVLEEGGGFRELLTAPYAFADDALAPLYGAEVRGGFELVEFDPNERQGFLMQVGFLAANAHAVKTDPIHRGLFVARNLLCKSIPDPDADFTQLGLPETDTPPRTTRDEVALLTGTNPNPDPEREATCGLCHGLINPAGFAFENFDAVGQLRTTENGVAVDTQGEMLIDGETRAFANAAELAQLVAESSEGRACYGSKLRSFAHGHDVAPDDPELSEALLEGGGTLSLARAIALSATFRIRVPNEVAP